MDYAFLEPWHAFLPREGGHVVSFFGGGGKTSLLSACAAALAAEGVAVAITTTTRTEPLQLPGLEVIAWQEFADEVGGGGPRLVGLHDGCFPDGKWRGLTPARVDELGALLPAHVVLVEADGSAKRPVKLHREDEPVWPARTSLAVAVMGLAALGRPVQEVLHRHGEIPSPWLPGDPQLPWTWDLMIRLVMGPDGYLGRVPVGVPAIAALTQVGGCSDAVGLFDCVGRLMTAVPIVVMAELGAGANFVRTTYRVAGAGAVAGGAA